MKSPVLHLPLETLTPTGVQRPSRAPTTSPNTNKLEPINPEAIYNAITPLPNFNLETEAPLKLRPFKPKFHMTMGSVSIMNLEHYDKH